ncbi:MAG: slipin family protein, partial [Planctomycetes bacterium]|nr:slipin family protein [Planctomycetota bacterium]
MFWKVVNVRQHERGLWFRDGDFVRVVEPGRYRVWQRPLTRRVHAIEVFDLLEPRFEHPLLRSLVEQPALREALTIVELGDDERAFVSIDGRLESILGPGLHAFWRGPRRIEIERHSVDELRLAHPRLDTILRLPSSASYLDGVEVSRHEVVLVFRNGELVETAGPGRHVFWRGRGTIAWKSIDLREQTLDVSGQEIMTQDKVTLRVNLVASYRVTDPVTARGALDKFTE